MPRDVTITSPFYGLYPKVCFQNLVLEVDLGYVYRKEGDNHIGVGSALLVLLGWVC